jgi:starch-binding outer membrane protein, SusD/RagB family
MIFWTLFSLLMAGNACKKFVEVSDPAGQPATSAVFANDANATAAMDGVYSLMMGSSDEFGDGAVTLFAGLSADEIYNTSPNPPIDQFTQNVLNSNNPLLQNNCWGDAYSTLYQVNAILEGLGASTGVSAAVKNQLTGEACCVRAYFYWYLSGLFGGVPLETNTNYLTNAVLPRMSLTQVDSQMVGDLNNAQNLMPAAYVTEGPLRPNKWTAAALLARVYLYQGNWSGALTESSMVINSGMYSLEPDPNKVFLAYSPEAIWQMTPVVPGLNTFEGNTFIPADSGLVPAYALDSGLLAAFEPGDTRKADWTGLVTLNGQFYYYPYKYKVQNGNTNTENYMMLRLAEQYLIRSEARAQTGDIPGAQADLDSVRHRAGLPPTLASNSTALLTAILQERRVELFAEWGHRWFDLKRTGEAAQVLGPQKPAWAATDTLYPIPLSQLQLNTFLTQNPGY